MINENEIKFINKVYFELYNSLDKIIVGQESAKKIVTTALLCSETSKILLSGNRGSGKTTLAKFLSKSFCSHQMYMRADMLPFEIEEELKEKLDTKFLQIDEFNRTSSKVLNVFIELFDNNEFTISNKTYSFKDFYVMATQNSKDIAGIFNISDAMYDRIDAVAYFENLSMEEKRYLLFEDFRPDNSHTLKTEHLPTVYQIASEFSLSKKDQNILMQVFSYVDNLKIDGKNFFAGDNIRGHKFAIKVAKLMALVNGRNYIMAGDIGNVLKSIYMHRINRSEWDLENEKVDNAFLELQDQVLKKVR